MSETQFVKQMYVYNLDEGEVLFTVRSTEPLHQETIEEIKNLDLDVYWSDERSIHWSFDTKLSDGAWLENITYSNDLLHAEAVFLSQ